MRLDLEQALTWKGTPMLSLFVGFQQASPLFRDQLQHQTEAQKVTEFFVLEQGETRYGLTWAIYDLSFSEIPSPLEAVVFEVLELTLSSGIPLAVFMFEGSFGLHYLAKSESARSTYAAQVSGAIITALEDEVRTSSAWAEELTSLKATVLAR
jgi:hypothetical protein